MTLDEALALASHPQPTAQKFTPLQGATVRRSARKERPALRAALDAGLRTLAAMAVSALLSLGAWQGFQWATHAPVFALRQIEVHGLVHARERDLIARSGLVRGENLFHADLAAAARGIEAHPWVETARLYRRPPSRIVVEVVEHVAVASVQLGSLYLLDASGAPFKKAAPGDGVDLPLVTGLSRADAGSSGARLRLFTALQLLDAWRAEKLPLAQLSEVRLDDDGGLTAFARDPGAAAGAGGGVASAAEDAAVQEIHLGARAFAQRLHRLAQIRAALARRGQRALRIDLDDDARPAWASAQLDRTPQQK